MKEFRLTPEEDRIPAINIPEFEIVASVRRDQTLLDDHRAKEKCGCGYCQYRARVDRSILYDEIEDQIGYPKRPKRSKHPWLPPQSPFNQEVPHG